ncbi:MAG TPA: BON domain-containing protein [Nitrospira sp.]|nr:BON domain-containing protein [Nitrospira sp.]
MSRTLRAWVLGVLWGTAAAVLPVNGFTQPATEKPTDVEVQTAIARVMETSPLTAGSLIVVHVNQGEVTLEGAAGSPLARREATRLAETVLGVKAIRNRLSVVNTQTAEIPAEQK